MVGFSTIRPSNLSISVMIMIKSIRYLFTSLCLLCSIMGFAQKSSPVVWDVAVTANSITEAVVSLTARIESGWRLYGLSLPKDGPHATSVSFDCPDGVSLEGRLEASRPAAERFDPIFSLKLAGWEGEVVLTQRFSITDSAAHEVSGQILYQANNDQTCLRPMRVPFTVTVGTGNTSETLSEQTESDIKASSSAYAKSQTHSDDDSVMPEEVSPRSDAGDIDTGVGHRLLYAFLIAILLFAAACLLGWISLKRQGEPQRPCAVRLILALVVLTLAIYLIPSLMGAPLGGYDNDPVVPTAETENITEQDLR